MDPLVHSYLNWREIMLQNNSLFKVAFLSLLIAVVTALTFNSCSKDEDVITPRVYDVAGTWAGKTSQNEDITFHVNSSGVVDTVLIYLKLDFIQFTCTAPFMCDTISQILNNKFTVPINCSITSVVSEITGNFVSAAKVTGTYKGYDAGASITCGNTWGYSSGGQLSDGTWEAVKQ